MADSPADIPQAVGTLADSTPCFCFVIYLRRSSVRVIRYSVSDVVFSELHNSDYFAMCDVV